MGGAGKTDGSRLWAALMADWTSSSATSRDSERLNWSTMTDAPPELVDVIWLKP
jgi:hypothetical protein